MSSYNSKRYPMYIHCGLHTNYNNINKINKIKLLSKKQHINIQKIKQKIYNN